MRTETVTVCENSSLDMIKRILWINVIFYPDEPIQCFFLSFSFLLFCFAFSLLFVLVQLIFKTSTCILKLKLKITRK